MKCNESRPGFELVSPCPFPTTITITPRAPPLTITPRAPPPLWPLLGWTGGRTIPIRSIGWSCRILKCLTNNEGLVDIQKYNSYFHSSTVTFVWSRNTVREISHISFFCGGQRTHMVELKSLLEWLGDLPLRLRNQRISLFAWETSGSPPFAWATISPKLPTLYCLFKSYLHIWTSFSPHVFLVYGSLSELTYFCFFQ